MIAIDLSTESNPDNDNKDPIGPDSKNKPPEQKPYKHDSALEEWEDEYDYLDGTIFPRWG